MKKLTLALLALVAVNSLAFGAEAFKLIGWKDLSTMMAKSDAKLAVYDANGDTMRKAEGIIPGAKLLPSTHFDASKVLPADKDTQLVFYCGNTQCMASHDAAKTAVAAGYKNVAVMSDGILGWKKAGQKTTVAN